jgi:hopene-associated glycosyltransferase HpnB
MEAGPSAALAAIGVAAWTVLLFARGRFWQARERLDADEPDRATWPAVVAVVPARNEANVIGRSIRSVVAQDYPGAFVTVLVDDHSADGTAAVARAAAEEAGYADRLATVASRAVPEGWAGKLWALSEGLRHARQLSPNAAFVWFTDADIAHDAQSLRRLVGKAEREDRDLVSVMVLLSCRRFWEKLLVPPFVFFFAMLYPFAWVNDRRARTAAAAGGCVLLRRAALERAGGLEPIRDAIIDDCALARLIKEHGRDGPGAIWLGLSAKLASIRPYEGLAGIWWMVVRSAYTQLGRSPFLLAGTLAGLAVVYLAPPVIVLSYPSTGNTAALALAAIAWAAMSIAFRPWLRLYRQSTLLAPALPVAAVLYCAMTVHSAVQHWRGRGGAWKGRLQGGRAGR